MKIKENILAILAECKIENNTLYLPPEQLDRTTYEAVNKCIVNIGGKWNRKAKGHMFDYDPTEALENLLFTGETEDMKKVFQFFPTPREIGDRMCEIAEINEHSRVLEPSAGKGDLVKAIIAAGAQSVYCMEVNPEMIMSLEKLNCAGTIVVVHCGDFLEAKLTDKININRVIMNPPFSKQQDINHIREAYTVLAPGGVLVSVISPSPFFRTNKKSVEFREWLAAINAEVVDLPPGAFKESGTMISTKIIKANKPY